MKKPVMKKKKPLLLKKPTEEEVTLPPEFRPTFHDIVKTFPDIKVYGDNKKVIKYDGFIGDEKVALALLIQAVIGGQCILLGGGAASGKTNLYSVIITYAKSPFEFTAGTEKAAIYDAEFNEKMVNADLYLISEINRISETNREMLKYFGEGDDYVYKRTKEEPITIPCKGFITCLADENKVSLQALGAELISRLTTLTLDSTMGQTKKVVNSYFTKKRNPFKRRNVDEDYIKNCQNYVRSLPYIYDYTFIHPAGELVANAIPCFFTTNRRDAPKYAANAEAVTMFFYYDRVKFEYNGKTVIPVTPIDEWYNYIIFGSLLKESALRCDSIQRQLLELVEDHDGFINIDLLTKEMKSKGHYLSLEVVKRKMDDMYENGYVIKSERYEKPAYRVSDEYIDFTQNMPWKEIVETSKRNFRLDWEGKIDEEIIQAYEAQCDNHLAVHPFTGKEVDITTWKEEKKSRRRRNKYTGEVQETEVTHIDTKNVTADGNARLSFGEDEPDEDVESVEIISVDDEL